MDDDFIDMMENGDISLDQNKKCVMCCCQKETDHDETMKFTLKYVQGSKDILNSTLFAKRDYGELIQLQEAERHRSKVTNVNNRQAIYGRFKEIHGIL